MQSVAQSFVVLDLTHSGTQLGLTSAARFLPMFLFGPIGGVFADRLDRQRVLYVTQTLSGLLAGVFAVTVGTHSIRLWIVYLLALALGFVNVFDNPARRSFISEMVSAKDLPNAVTLNSVAMNMARVFGAALGGVIAAAIGLALCFTCNALSFGAVLVSLAAMRGSELFPAKRVSRQKRQVRQGLRYVRSTPELFIPLLMIAVIGTLAWEFQVSLPLMASKVFHGGAGSYGVMASVMGGGAVVGGLISAARSPPRQPYRRPGAGWSSARDQLGQPGRVKRRADRVRRPPDHAVLGLGIVPDELLLDFVGRLVGKGRGEDEHHLVLGPVPPRKDVFQHAEPPHAGQFLADLLEKLPVNSVHRVLAELHVPAERPLEQRV